MHKLCLLMGGRLARKMCLAQGIDCARHGELLLT